MVLELHIWGPAFGLPSIDAQCLATIFYLRKCLHNNEWTLIPSSEPGISPLGELPALRDDDNWVAGFADIADYLRDVSNGDWDLDKNLDDKQQADCAALSAFVGSRGHPLLDLSLYVSSDNYLNCTRQALGNILTWPNSWTLPHQLRARAKKRSEHLGLSSLDVDTAQEDKNEDVGLTVQIPKSLRRPKQTVSGLLGRNTQRNRFRLDAVTEDFFDPLAEMLGNNSWLLGEHESSADCLAIGYLALMQLPQLQHGWVREALQSKYPKLEQWVRKQATQAFGSPVDVAMVLGGKTGSYASGGELPWKVPAQRSFRQVFHSVLEGCVSSIPVMGSVQPRSEIGYTHEGDGDRYRQKQLQLTRLRDRRERSLEILVSTLSTISLVAWLIQRGVMAFPSRTPVPRGRRFGEAGTLLGLG